MKPSQTPRTPISHPLSRENRLASRGPWALPRHRLSVGRTRVAGAGLGAGCRVRGLTGPGAGDVCPVREVFVTVISVDRGGDTFNPGRRVFSPTAGKVSQLRGTAELLDPERGRRS